MFSQISGASFNSERTFQIFSERKTRSKINNLYRKTFLMLLFRIRKLTKRFLPIKNLGTLTTTGLARTYSKIFSPNLRPECARRGQQFRLELAFLII